MASYKIIGGDGGQYGPAEAADVLRWIGEGRLNGKSQACIEGTEEWKTLDQFPEFAQALRAEAGPPPPPLPPGSLPSLEAWEARTLQRIPEVRIGYYLGQSFQLIRENFGVLMGASTLLWLISAVCQFVPMGGLIFLVIAGALYGGLYLVFLNRIRGKPATVGGVFAGFGPFFGQLLLAGLVSRLLTLLGCCCLLFPGIYFFVAWIFCVPLTADKRMEFWSAMELSRKVVSRVWFQILGLILIAYLPTILAQLVVGARMSSLVSKELQDALSGSQPDFSAMLRLGMELAKSTIPLQLLAKAVQLVNLPFITAALMYAYEDLFGSRPTSAA